MKPLFKKSNSQQFNYDIEIADIKPVNNVKSDK